MSAISSSRVRHAHHMKGGHAIKLAVKPRWCSLQVAAGEHAWACMGMHAQHRLLLLHSAWHPHNLH